MATLTPNYDLYLPDINGDEAAWGQMLNANFTALDTLLAAIAGLGVGVEEAPTDGANYVRDGLNNAWNAGLSAAEMALAYVPLEPDAGEGITFQNVGTVAVGATSDSQLLAFYEEGEWTPNVWDTSSSSAEGQTYSIQNGKFTRVGNVVDISGRIALTDKGFLLGSSNVRIGPLPYVSNASDYENGGVTVTLFSNLNLADPTANLGGYVVDGVNYFTLSNNSLITGTNPVTVNELNDNSIITFFGRYWI